jgi:hypothetical protein
MGGFDNPRRHGSFVAPDSNIEEYLAGAEENLALPFSEIPASKSLT